MSDHRLRAETLTRFAIPFAFCCLIPLLAVIYSQQKRNDEHLRDATYLNLATERNANIASCRRVNILRARVRETRDVLLGEIHALLPSFEAQAKLLQARLTGDHLTATVERGTKAALASYRLLIVTFKRYRSAAPADVDCLHVFPPVVRADVH